VFDSKIALVLRDDLAAWQALNVTAFLMSGLTAQAPELIGAPYRDRDGCLYNPLSRQPVVVLSAPAALMTTIRRRGLDRGVVMSAYIEEMFATGHDAANREVFAAFGADDAKTVGLGLHAGKKTVDKVTKGARLHS